MTEVGSRPYNQPMVTTIDGSDMSIPFTLTINAVAFVWAGSTVTTTITDLLDNPAAVTALTFTQGAAGAGTISLTAAQKTTLGVGTFKYSFVITVGSALQFEMGGQFSIHLKTDPGSTTLGIAAVVTNGTVTVALTTTGMTLAQADARYAPISAIPASTVAITDSADYWTSTDLESWDQEVGANLATLGRPGTGVYFRQPGTVSSAVATQSRLFYQRIEVGRGFTIDRIGARVTVLAGSSAVRLGVYASGANGYPGALLVDAGTIDTAAGGTGQKELTISQAVTRGRFWLAAVAQGGAPTMATVINTPITAMGFTAAVNVTLATMVTVNSGCLYEDAVTGSLPPNATAIYDNTTTAGILTYARMQ